ncbi:DUF695 domain-containing protein [Hymenobacter negativus]|nr:DUF695 domain-containing protein [Hymenobacter negativus]
MAAFAQTNKIPTENWCIQKAIDQDNNIIFITANLGYKDYAYKAEFPWCLEINITTIHQYPNGHPNSEEAPVLNETEDIITAALQKAGVTHFVGRTTVKGYRELYYFVADPEKANAALGRLTKKRQPREWEYRMGKDEDWQRVAPFFAGNIECL